MSINIDGIEFLSECTNEQLDPLVQIILEKGKLTELLSGSKIYVQNSPNHRVYVDLIQKEIIEFGSNTFGANRTYKKILMNVCKKMEVSYTSSSSIEEIENDLLANISEKMWDKLSDNDKKALLQSLNIQEDFIRKKGAAAFMALFRAGGFASYQLSVIVANSVAKFVLGRGLAFATNAALTRALSIVTGPIGWVLTAAWTVFDIAGPAYRVTVPAVTYIASLRKIYKKS